MKITYDETVDAAYLKLKKEDDISPFGFTYCCDTDVVGTMINLDFDCEGRLIGVEILDASKKLPEYLLKKN